MEKYFRIRYEFVKELVWRSVDETLSRDESGYICVADGVIVNTVNRDASYRKVVDGSLFAICDSSWVPVYLKWIYGIRREQYCGAMIFKDLIGQCRHRMIFMGTRQRTLDALQSNLTTINPGVKNMLFYELPFKSVDDFDYRSIARMIDDDGADIIWVALGAPKQEIFMSKLRPHLRRGVMIAVGAAFKFYSGLEEKRAPEWLRKNHLEFLYRIMCDPKKQLKRCGWIVAMMPKLLWEEWRRKMKKDDSCVL